MRTKGVHVFALVGIVIGATLFGWSDADAVLCVTKNKKGAVTKVTIRGGACKVKESVGDPNVLLGLATTTTSPTTTTTLSPSTGTGPRIVDSAGNEIGSFSAIADMILAVRTIEDQAMAFPVSTFGPSLSDAYGNFGVDDFQLRFAHQGTECAGDRFATSLDPLSFDLLRFVYPSTDGKSGYVLAASVGEISTWAQDDFNFTCAAPPSPLPPTVTCDDLPPPEPGPAVRTPVGSAFPCSVKTLFQQPPGTQCMCIRCCVTRDNFPHPMYRVQTVDLGLGNVTPPFKIEP